MFANLIRTTALTSLAAFSLCTVGSATELTQDQDRGQNQNQSQMEQQQPQTGQTQDSYSEEKLDSYADAALKVAKISLKVAPQIQSAETEQLKEDLFLRMQQDMVSAVQATDGITVQEYNQISLAARQDVNLANKIQSKFEDLQRRTTQ